LIDSTDCPAGVDVTIAGSQKAVALKFKVTEGPKVKISSVDFVGNKVFGDGKLKRRMKNNKGGGFWIFRGSGVYQEDKFEEDAQAIVDFYRQNGPSVVAGAQLLHASNSFGMDGYLALLVGQDVPHEKPYSPSVSEAKTWRDRCMSWSHEARRGWSRWGCR